MNFHRRGAEDSQRFAEFFEITKQTESPKQTEEVFLCVPLRVLCASAVNQP
jgi:hypothetical protein